MTAPATATGIVCGKCSTFSTKIRHANVAAVRGCSRDNAPAPMPIVVKIDTLPPVPGAIRTLIDPAKVATVPAARKPAEDVVPAGHYALEIGGTVRFFDVSHGRKGTRWEGRVFVSRQAGDELHPVRNGGERTGILAAILVDPRAASARYGRELGRCGVCSRTLTDPESIAQGIGPICAGRF